MSKAPEVAPYSTVMRQEWTTWGQLMGLEPPWPATCGRCGADLGEIDDRDRLTATIAAHVRRCTWRRLAWRWLVRRWSTVGGAR